MKFKGLAPIEVCQLISQDSKESMITRLKKEVDPRQDPPVPAPFSKASKPFYGTIETTEFTISRIAIYRDELLPIINGIISTTDYKTSIELNIRLKPHAYKLFRFFFIFSAALFLLNLLLWIFFDKSFQETAFFFLGFLLIINLITIGSFKYQAFQAKKILMRIFNAKEKENVKGF
ncbi:MAG TPA: hypothetical protein VFF27_13575 [Bacteroidia bacterium]|jgi:hypothetical protein|nr:hypothetical protein [Bacteroidia bacterium]